MENERQKGMNLVPSPKATAELIPEPTAELIEKSFAENTIRNRRLALKHFDEWLNGQPCPDGLLAEYITHLFDEGKAPGTISIAVSAMKWLLKHRSSGQPVDLPITSATLSGIRREGRDRGRGQRNGLTWREVEKICAVQEADGTLRGIRNSAILRVMSDGLLRISEVTELRIDDLEDNTLRVRFSKTDQEGEGEYLYLCEDTRLIVQKWLKRSELTDKVSGHSLRIGTTVSLAQAGATLVDIQTAGRWKDPGMPAHYARAQFAERGAIARFKDGK